MQFDQVLTPSLLPLPVVAPAFDADLELVGDQFQQGQGRRLIDAKEDAREAKVAELDCKAQAVRRPAPLPNDGEVGIAERVMSDQVILGIRQRQQAFPLGGQDRTAWHTVSFFLKTRDFDKPHRVTDTAHKIKALLFSQIVLETIFLNNYHDNEF